MISVGIISGKTADLCMTEILGGGKGKALNLNHCETGRKKKGAIFTRPTSSGGRLKHILIDGFDH